MNLEMSPDIVVREWRDRRIIAALRFIDATTGGSIRQPLQLQIQLQAPPSRPPSRFVRNLSGHYVLMEAPGFESYSQTFNLDDLAAPPPITAINIGINDPSGQYLSRQFSLPVPRDPAIDPASATGESSLFQPVRIALYPSTNAPVNPGWAVLRTTVVNIATNERLPWAIVVVSAPAILPADTPIVAQSDWRGEALIGVPGIPITTWATGSGDGPGSPPVTTTEVEATLEVVFDPVVIPIPEAADFTRLVDPNPDYSPNPEQLNANRSGLLVGSVPFTLASGRDLSHRLAVTLAAVP
ncbi:MAG: hypothetical protein WBB01_01540 [Phormidesmis sp.]